MNYNSSQAGGLKTIVPATTRNPWKLERGEKMTQSKNEKEFTAAADRLQEPERGLTLTLVTWMRENGDPPEFGDDEEGLGRRMTMVVGDQKPFAIYLRTKSKSARIVIRFAIIRASPAFMTKMRRRFIEVDDYSRISRDANDDDKVSRPISSLNKEPRLRNFLAAMEWSVTELKKMKKKPAVAPR